jgi:hypothetical protein
VIIEDHEIATSAWGLYSGMEMMWIPVAYPLGMSGTTISFSGPYPQTIYLNGSYTLNPVSHIFNNLRVVTFVQETSGIKEVMNANYMDLPDTATGVYDTTAGLVSGSVLTVGPNPSAGMLSICSVLPGDATGTVSIYDIQGRIIDTLPAGTVVTTDVDEPGIYFVRLTTSTGEVVTRQCTVLN